LFKKDRKTKNEHGIIICGHRGGSNKSEPENTIRAFEYAIKNGTKIIEFDVSVKYFFYIFLGLANK
jgi:glycerophosphoryl diester phosphodiesterase